MVRTDGRLTSLSWEGKGVGPEGRGEEGGGETQGFTENDDANMVMGPAVLKRV
jgi:hypothetical protein